jgi:hypothetical protein
MIPGAFIGLAILAALIYGFWLVPPVAKAIIVTTAVFMCIFARPAYELGECILGPEKKDAH